MDPLKFAKVVKFFLPKCRNFAKLSHTGCRGFDNKLFYKSSPNILQIIFRLVTLEREVSVWIQLKQFLNIIV